MLWYTAAQLAKLQLPGVPRTERGVQFAADRGQWRKQKRQGRGGGWEYAADSLPAEARLELVRRETANAVPALTVPAGTPVVTTPAADLRSYQSAPMKARQIILDHISAQILQLGVSRSAAETEFCRMAHAGTLPAHLQQAARDANARAGEGRVVSTGSLRRWHQELQRGGAEALAVKATNVRTDLPAWFPPFWQVYAIPSKPTVAAAYEELQRRVAGIDLPHLRSVQRFVDSLDAITRNRGRFGPREMKKFRAYRTRDDSMLLPTDIYTADGHKADLEVVTPDGRRIIRPEIITVLDVPSRKVVGWSAGHSESGHNVRQALLNAASVHGICAIFYVDNGSGFVNEEMEHAITGLLGRLGITMHNSLPYSSQSRGVIERFHQMWVRAAKFKPSFMGADMDAEAKNLVFKRGRKEIATIGQSRLVMTWSDFLVWAQQRIDDYNNRPHSHFDKILDPVTLKRRHPSPNEVWQQFVDQGFELDLPDARVIDDAERPYKLAIVQRGQVRINNATYGHERLDADGWHGEQVQVGYDLHDASKVWVRAEDGRLICVARLDWNKVPYMPKAAIEQARDRRLTVKIRNADRKAEDLRVERDGERPQPAFTVIENLTPEQEAHADSQYAAIELQALPAPAAPADGERPTFINDEAWIEWMKAGNGDADDRAEFARRCANPGFCMAYDIPMPNQGSGDEADLRAAG
jgi:putative transposase